MCLCHALEMMAAENLRIHRLADNSKRAHLFEFPIRTGYNFLAIKNEILYGTKELSPHGQGSLVRRTGKKSSRKKELALNEKSTFSY